MSKCSFEIFNELKKLNNKMIINFYKYFFNLRMKLTEIIEYNKINYNYFNYIYEIENIDLDEANKLFLILIKILKLTMYYNDYIIFVNKKKIMTQLRQTNPIKYGGSLFMKLLIIISSMSNIASLSDGNIDNFIKRETHPTFNKAIEKLSANFDGMCVMNAITVSMPTEKLLGDVATDIFQQYKSRLADTPDVFHYGLYYRTDHRIESLLELRESLEHINNHLHFNKYNNLIISMITIKNKHDDFYHQFNVFYNRYTQKIMLFDRNFQFPIYDTSPYIFYEDGFFTSEQEALLKYKIHKPTHHDILSYILYMNDLPMTDNFISIETIDDYDGVNLFSTTQKAIDDINNFHLIRNAIHNPDIPSIESYISSLNGGGNQGFSSNSIQKIKNILKNNIYYFIIFCLYKNNVFNENSITYLKKYKNFFYGLLNKNKLVYIKYLICLLNTNNLNKTELLTLSENIIKLEQKYKLYFTVVYNKLDIIDDLIISFSTKKIKKLNYLYAIYLDKLNMLIKTQKYNLFINKCIQRINHIDQKLINSINNTIDNRIKLDSTLIYSF